MNGCSNPIGLVLAKIFGGKAGEQPFLRIIDVLGDRTYRRLAWIVDTNWNKFVFIDVIDRVFKGIGSNFIKIRNLVFLILYKDSTIVKKVVDA
jgi:hypothetical protein